MRSEHGGDQRREVACTPVEEVDALRRRAAGEHLHARREAGRRDQVARAAGGRTPAPAGSRSRARPATITCAVVARSGRRSGRTAARRRWRPRGRARSAVDEPADRGLRPSRSSTEPCLRRRRARSTARPRPGRRPAASTSKPRTDCGVRGMPKVEPGVSWSANAGSAAATSTAPPTARKTTGRAMIARASRAQKPCVGIERLARAGSACARRRGGRRARAAPAAASRRRRSRRSGSGSPATPIIRMNGSGIATSSASPSATAMPEKITDAAGRLHRAHDRVVLVLGPSPAPRGSGRR